MERFKCPKCKQTTYYLDHFDEEYINNKHIVYWHVKCPKCLSYYIIGEKYELNKIDLIW